MPNFLNVVVQWYQMYSTETESEEYVNKWNWWGHFRKIQYAASSQGT